MQEEMLTFWELHHNFSHSAEGANSLFNCPWS